jgi:hypothetical protein
VNEEEIVLKMMSISISYKLSSGILTPWCKILFEKLIVTQLVKKYPAFLQNPKVHHRMTV